jgi:hypothetical protein
MTPKIFVIALLFVVSLNLTNLPGQDSGCTRRTVPVGVVDREWNFAQGLSPANFRAKLHGHDVEILSASIDTSPRRIVLLLDASGSMMYPDGGGWKTERTISEYLTRFAPPRASISFMGFTGMVLDTEGFDENPQALLKNLSVLVRVCERPQKARRTALFDAIMSARDLLRAPNLGDVICALTDARDTVSRTEPKKLQEELLRTGVRLFGVVIAAPWGRARTPEEDSSQFDSLVRATGGSELVLRLGGWSPTNPHIEAKTKEDSLDLALHRLLEQMGEFYRFELALPETVDKPTKWKLEVIDAGGKPMREVEVHYPQELMPCAKASP